MKSDILSLMDLSNQQIARIFRGVAAAYTIKKIGNLFQIRAYENAADSIEHSSAEIQDLWQENKLDTIPGLGPGIISYLNELFGTGQVKHFQLVEKGIPKVVFELLDVPGIGPKTAQEIAKLKVEDIDDLKRQIKSGELVKKGFSARIAQKIMDGITQLKSRGGRMLLPYASIQADRILVYLKKCQEIEQVNPLGSLRRKVATIGDLDFAASSKSPKKVVEYFTKMPGVRRILEQGENKATVVLNSGIQTDLLVGEPSSYGALLQHFTGSKNHNIHLRTIAEKKGLSLSEYGIRSGKKEFPLKTEEELYRYLGLNTPAPEIREDTGEIEAALRQTQGKTDGLPNLVEEKDIKGDLHLHSNFPLEPSHGPGVDSIEEMIKQAQVLKYQYVGISDHSPAFTTHTPEQIEFLIEKRTKFIQNLRKNTNSIRVLNGLEIDILLDGSLSVQDETLKTLDYVIAGIHSGHRGPKEEITKRLLSALENLNVDIISHPTNRLLNERDSSDADWEEIFKVASKNHKVLEINAFPNRLDLRDDLVRLALNYGVKFIVDTDAHQVSQMSNMAFGVAVARRGWATKKDIVNTWDWKDFAKWFNIHL